MPWSTSLSTACRRSGRSPASSSGSPPASRPFDRAEKRSSCVAWPGAPAIGSRPARWCACGAKLLAATTRAQGAARGRRLRAVGPARALGHCPRPFRLAEPHPAHHQHLARRSGCWRTGRCNSRVLPLPDERDPWWSSLLDTSVRPLRVVGPPAVRPGRGLSRGQRRLRGGGHRARPVRVGCQPAGA